MRNTKKARPTVSKTRLTLPRELSLAGKRIGAGSTKRMKWLLSFAYMNLDDLSEGQRSDLAWEINAFILPGKTNEFLASSKPGIISMNFDPKIVSAAAIPASDATVRTLQDFTKAGLQAAFSGGWEFTYPKRTETITLDSRGSEKKVGLVFTGFFDIPSLEQALKEIFETTSFDLIKAEMDRLGICGNPRCRKPFVTEKKGKGRFCSPRCSAYVRIAKFRGKELPEEKTVASTVHRVARPTST